MAQNNHAVTRNMVERFSVDQGPKGLCFYGDYSLSIYGPTNMILNVEFNAAPRFSATDFVRLLKEKGHVGNAEAFGVSITVSGFENDPETFRDELQMLWMSMINCVARNERAQKQVEKEWGSIEA